MSRPEALISLETLLEMQSLGPHLRLVASETQFWCYEKFEATDINYKKIMKIK